MHLRHYQKGEFALKCFWVQLVLSSTLLGLYFGSLLFFLLSFFLGLIMYFYVLNHLVSPQVMNIFLTVVWTLTAILWGGHLDAVFGTALMAILFGAFAAIASYGANKHLTHLWFGDVQDRF